MAFFLNFYYLLHMPQLNVSVRKFPLKSVEGITKHIPSPGTSSKLAGYFPKHRKKKSSQLVSWCK